MKGFKEKIKEVEVSQLVVGSTVEVLGAQILLPDDNLHKNKTSIVASSAEPTHERSSCQKQTRKREPVIVRATRLPRRHGGQAHTQEWREGAGGK